MLEENKSEVHTLFSLICHEVVLMFIDSLFFVPFLRGQSDLCQELCWIKAPAWGAAGSE